MDRLDELEVLRAIADAGSLAGAARRLRRSPPVITRALAALEDRVGMRLAERTTRRFSLTQAGTSLAERARALLADYEAAVRPDASGAVRGLLRVTAPVLFGRRHVAPVVSSFIDRYRETQVELVLNDRNLDLVDERLDVAVRIGDLADSRLVVRRLGAVTRVAVASPLYLAKRGEPHRPGDLRAHDVIFGALQASVPEWRFGPARKPTVVRLAPRLFVNDLDAVLAAAREGRGIAHLLSYQVVEDLASGGLKRILVEFEPDPHPVHLVTSGATHRAPLLRAFLDHASAALRALDVLHE